MGCRPSCLPCGATSLWSRPSPPYSRSRGLAFSPSARSPCALSGALRPRARPLQLALDPSVSLNGAAVATVLIYSSGAFTAMLGQAIPEGKAGLGKDRRRRHEPGRLRPSGWHPRPGPWKGNLAGVLTGVTAGCPTPATASSEGRPPIEGWIHGLPSSTPSPSRPFSSFSSIACRARRCPDPRGR